MKVFIILFMCSVVVFYLVHFSNKKNSKNEVEVKEKNHNKYVKLDYFENEYKRVQKELDEMYKKDTKDLDEMYYSSIETINSSFDNSSDLKECDSEV